MVVLDKRKAVIAASGICWITRCNKTFNQVSPVYLTACTAFCRNSRRRCLFSLKRSTLLYFHCFSRSAWWKKKWPPLILLFSWRTLILFRSLLICVCCPQVQFRVDGQPGFCSAKVGLTSELFFYFFFTALMYSFSPLMCLNVLFLSFSHAERFSCAGSWTGS